MHPNPADCPPLFPSAERFAAPLRLSGTDPAGLNAGDRPLPRTQNGAVAAVSPETAARAFFLTKDRKLFL